MFGNCKVRWCLCLKGVRFWWMVEVCRFQRVFDIRCILYYYYYILYYYIIHILYSSLLLSSFISFHSFSPLPHPFRSILLSYSSSFTSSSLPPFLCSLLLFFPSSLILYLSVLTYTYLYSLLPIFPNKLSIKYGKEYIYL